MEHFPVSVVDIVAVLIICLSTLRGFHRGLSGELAQLVSLILAFVVGVYTYRPFGTWILNNTHASSRTAHTVAFVVAVASVILAAVLLGFVFRRIMKIVFDPKVDKPGGGLAGFVSGTLAVILILVMLNLWPHAYLNRKCGEESVIGRLVVKFMPAVREKADELPVTRDVKKEIRKATEL
jgi:uncharacterized membrane protein required for colicin V production